jgi:uncharacterized membrane protein
MLYELSYVFLLFVIYSFIGWLIETIVVYLGTKKWINRGFLIGPYCPIYGFGALLMIYIFEEYKSDPLNLYIMLVVYASILEYFTSFLMERLFNARWWDYSERKFNLNGRVCLSNSLAFGVLGLILGFFLNPLLLNLISTIHYNILYLLMLITAVVFVTDLLLTFNIVTKLRRNIVLLNKDMTEEINEEIDKFIKNSHIVKSFPLLNQKIIKK